jgi:2-polyprenyl-3-methyl-5-hydroxy-6-metoxy-1,4-benzoquinol methylase
MKCPVCLNSATAPALTGRDVLFETTSREFKLNACRQCDCLFINPLPGDQEVASFYPSQYWWNASKPSLLKRAESLYRRMALRGHVAFIQSAASRLQKKQGIRLLDIGCGSATLLGLMKNRGFDVLGVDTSAEASQVAAKENGVRVVVGTIANAALPTSSADVVTMFHVMEHVTNPQDVLADAHRILEAGGTLVLQVPNIDSWQFHWFGAKWYGLDIPRHVIDYSRASIVKLLERSGFQVTRIRHFNLRDNAPALVSSLFPSLDPVSRPIRLRHRNITESAPVSWCKHLAYLTLVFCAYPIVILESATRHGATVMIEARKR